MNLKKPERRFEQATQAIVNIKNSKTVNEYEDNWRSFLTSANGVYSTLEQAMKGSERTEQAFKRLKAERKKDPLMQYLHQARNAEEHSIQEVTETVPGATTIGGGGPEFSKAFRASFSINNGVLGGVGGNPPEISPLDGKPVLIKQIGPQVKLKSVTNYGKKYPVPREHKGKEIEIPTPIEAAEFALSYLSEVLEKVRKIEAR